MINTASDSHRLNFRLVHLLYVTAFVASALATFGVRGLALGAPILAIWTHVFTSRQRPRALGRAVIASVVLCCLAGMLLPEVSSATDLARSLQCTNNLKQITFALHTYHDAYGSSPPAFVADENGKPKHSWRVLILPFLDGQRLYESYSFDEPWDGPNNKKLAATYMPNYACPCDPGAAANGMTSYFAVVGPQTCWPGTRSRKLPKVANDKSPTILVVEGPARFNWMEPSDMSVEDATDFLSAPESDNDSHANVSYFFWPGRRVGLSDGSVQSLSMTRDDWEALLTIDDGDTAEQNLALARAGYRRLKIGNCFRLGLFVLLVVWPLPWVWICPGSDRAAPRER